MPVELDMLDDTTRLILVHGVCWLTLYTKAYVAAHTILWDASAREGSCLLLNLRRGEDRARRVHDWASEVVSTTHSALQTAASFYLFWARSANPAVYEAWVRPWVVSLGAYMAFDSLVCLRHGAFLFRRTPGLIAHHLIVGMSNFYALYSGPFYVHCQVIACLCEANSVFLHIRSAIKMVRPRLAAWRWPNEVLVLLTFLTVRFTSSGYLVWQVAQLQAGSHSDRELQSTITTFDLAFWTFCALGLFGVNVVAFFALVRGYMRAARVTAAKKGA